MGLGRGIGYDAGQDSGGSGTVTSVGLVAPGIFTVSGSPVTISGDLVLNLATQAANRVWAGPVSGSPGVPTFRALVPADIPALPSSGWSLTGNTGTDPVNNYIGTTDAILLIKSFGTVAIRIMANRVNLAGNDTNTNNSFGSAMIGGFGNNINSGNNYNTVLNAVSGTITGGLNLMLNGEGSTITGNNNITAGSRLNVNSHNGVVMMGDYAGTVLNSTSDDALFSRFVNGQKHYLSPGVLGYELLPGGLFRFKNTVGFSAVPSIVLGAGAGTGALVSIGGTNQAGVITITVGTSPASLDDLFTLTYSGGLTYPNNSVLPLTPVSTAGATFLLNATVANSATTATWRTGTSAPAPGSILQFQYIGIGY